MIRLLGIMSRRDRSRPIVVTARGLHRLLTGLGLHLHLRATIRTMQAKPLLDVVAIRLGTELAGAAYTLAV